MMLAIAISTSDLDFFHLTEVTKVNFHGKLLLQHIWSMCTASARSLLTDADRCQNQLKSNWNGFVWKQCPPKLLCAAESDRETCMLNQNFFTEIAYSDHISSSLVVFGYSLTLYTPFSDRPNWILTMGRTPASFGFQVASPARLRCWNLRDFEWSWRVIRNVVANHPGCLTSLKFRGHTFTSSDIC